MTVQDLPSVNATLNLISSLFLLLGYIYVKRGKPEVHKKLMIGALVSSALFLICYLVYHYAVGSVPYAKQDWTRPVYFAILIPHVILAAVMVPFILLAVWHAFRGNFVKHTRITKWLWPVWMFVSVSGVVVYLMLYQL